MSGNRFLGPLQTDKGPEKTSFDFIWVRFPLFWMFMVVSEVQGGQNRVRHVQIHPYAPVVEYLVDFVQLSKRVLFFFNWFFGIPFW